MRATGKHAGWLIIFHQSVIASPWHRVPVACRSNMQYFFLFYGLLFVRQSFGGLMYFPSKLKLIKSYKSSVH